MIARRGLLGMLGLGAAAPAAVAEAVVSSTVPPPVGHKGWEPTASELENMEKVSRDLEAADRAYHANQEAFKSAYNLAHRAFTRDNERNETYCSHYEVECLRAAHKAMPLWRAVEIAQDKERALKRRQNAARYRLDDVLEGLKAKFGIDNY